MPVLEPVLYPPFNIVRVSHVVYGVRNLAASRAFYVDTLGLQVTHSDAKSLHLRAMEERGHHCIALRESSEPAVEALGFKLFDETDSRQGGRIPPIPGPPRGVGGAPVHGPDATGPGSLGHSAGILLQDGAPRADPPAIRPVSRSESTANRPCQPVCAGRRTPRSRSMATSASG